MSGRFLCVLLDDCFPPRFHWSPGPRLALLLNAQPGLNSFNLSLWVWNIHLIPPRTLSYKFWICSSTIWLRFQDYGSLIKPPVRQLLVITPLIITWYGTNTLIGQVVKQSLNWRLTHWIWLRFFFFFVTGLRCTQPPHLLFSRSRNLLQRGSFQCRSPDFISRTSLDLSISISWSLSFFPSISMFHTSLEPSFLWQL